MLDDQEPKEPISVGNIEADDVNANWIKHVRRDREAREREAAEQPEKAPPDEQDQ